MRAWNETSKYPPWPSLGIFLTFIVFVVFFFPAFVNLTGAVNNCFERGAVEFACYKQFRKICRQHAGYFLHCQQDDTFLFGDSGLQRLEEP